MKITLMKLLFSNQYNNMLDIINNLMAENERLKSENAELAEEIYSLSEDIACLRWNLKADHSFIDFPNSDHKASSPVDKIY